MVLFKQINHDALVVQGRVSHLSENKKITKTPNISSMTSPVSPGSCKMSPVAETSGESVHCVAGLHVHQAPLGQHPQGSL